MCMLGVLLICLCGSGGSGTTVRSAATAARSELTFALCCALSPLLALLFYSSVTMEKNGIEQLLRAEDEAAAIVQKARERTDTHGQQQRHSEDDQQQHQQRQHTSAQQQRQRQSPVGPHEVASGGDAREAVVAPW